MKTGFSARASRGVGHCSDSFAHTPRTIGNRARARAMPSGRRAHSPLPSRRAESARPCR